MERDLKVEKPIQETMMPAASFSTRSPRWQTPGDLNDSAKLQAAASQVTALSEEQKSLFAADNAER